MHNSATVRHNSQTVRRDKQVEKRQEQAPQQQVVEDSREEDLQVVNCNKLMKMPADCLPQQTAAHGGNSQDSHE